MGFGGGDALSPTLSLKHISKRFGRVTALQDLSLDVYPDELLVILGPTGAGKTTLLRTIAGLEYPDEGTLYIGDQDVALIPPAGRNVALVFQNFSLYPDWTVLENMAFPLKAPGQNLSADEIRSRIDWAADILKIRPLLDKPATRLSGGEMQRVAIGRAIVRRPRLFLLDEPLTNLDAKLREALRVELVTLRRTLKTPMVFVTHDQMEAMSMGDRIIVLHEGTVLQEGTPEDIYAHPVSPTVARQLGQPPINLFSVTIQNGMFTAEDGTEIIPAVGEDERAVLGIRPEHIEPSGGKHSGLVRVVEHMGPMTILVVQWARQEIRLIVPKHHQVKVGDEIYPQVRHEKAVVWSADGPS
jgi:multiple sugar transport system ATP-binding protein